MSIQDRAALGEIVSSIAILITLILSPYGRALWNSPLIREDFDRGFQESIDEWVSTLRRSDSDVMLPRIVPDGS